MIEETVKKLIEEENGSISEVGLYQLCGNIVSRMCLRLGTEELPPEFNHIAVDACIKLYRRRYYEGISSENCGGLSVSFVEDLLNEYSKEVEMYKEMNAKGSETETVI